MNKQQQIGEMAQIINGSTELDTVAYYRCMNIAKTIYNAGYRKIDDNCAVITKGELQEYKRQAVKEFAERLKERMGERDYMGVKYKQGVFSENDIGELLKEYE